VLLYFGRAEIGDDDEATAVRRLGILEDLDLDCDAHANDMMDW